MLAVATESTIPVNVLILITHRLNILLTHEQEKHITCCFKPHTFHSKTPGLIRPIFQDQYALFRNFQAWKFLILNSCTFQSPYKCCRCVSRGSIDSQIIIVLVPYSLHSLQVYRPTIRGYRCMHSRNHCDILQWHRISCCKFLPLIGGFLATSHWVDLKVVHKHIRHHRHWYGIEMTGSKSV